MKPGLSFLFLQSSSLFDSIPEIYLRVFCFEILDFRTSWFFSQRGEEQISPNQRPNPGAKACSSSITKQKPDPTPVEEPNNQKITKVKALKLFYSRELNDNLIPLDKKMSNFKEEVQKTQASNPVVWRYKSTATAGDCALKQMQVDVQTSVGLSRKNILVAGSFCGCLSVLRVSKPRQIVDFASECVPVSVLSPKEDDAEEREAPWLIWRQAPADTYLNPNLFAISSIELIGSYDASENSHPVNRALITTLMSTDRGSIFILDVTDKGNILTPLKLQGRVSSKCIFWTTACNISGSHAAIGTNLGAALVDLETGSGSYFLRSKSDVLKLQFHQSGNLVHCGLRNGAIVTVDLRERPGKPFPRLNRHQIQYQSSSKTAKTNKHWFELQGNINPSHVIFMPSSISCLKTLRTSDQYLMASSMDGTMRLYDQRMVKKGVAVQTYERHVNSHFRIQFGIDPTERFLLSGGGDCYTRIWNIKSGQLMSENKFSKSVPSVVCWSADERQRDRRNSIIHGAWLGSCEAIFHVS